MELTEIFAMPHPNKSKYSRSVTLLLDRANLARAIFALFVLPLLAGCDDTSVAPPALRLVKTWTVAAEQPVPYATWSGTIEPAEEVTLHFRIDGKLGERPVDIGSEVKKGQIVATLNGSLSKEEAAATLAEYLGAVAAEQKGRQELERVRKLYAIGTASRAQLEEATASAAALNARKIRGQAQKSGALNESEFNKLTAPFDGIITLYTPSAGQSVMAGQEVVKIASKKAEAQFSIPSGFISRLHPGDSVFVIVNGLRTEARIRYISPQLDSVTRTSLVRASLPPLEHEWVYGAAVSVELQTSDKVSLSVPASSLARSGNRPAVFVVNPQSGRLESRAVVIQRFSADKIYISEGLKAGERVVIAGVTTLMSGEKVGVMPEATK
ncbi:efflux RND transporter periplasmic adaptor subunit [Enterobacteriaceae bacterium H18W14]|uniref:efflux RND transporter periplasmic adaptor subunit n=1 Tax=Dryocola boscaweniae TaxID=2925397 RepID=UPI0022EFE7D5|nr:efflux RND transporter periplasmic adaptor subunit [Dryocola boscaweniae]MCT4715468.1 efflux RND transporter periplasmic adaptor subunit [Dryocola boscaweniae]